MAKYQYGYHRPRSGYHDRPGWYGHYIKVMLEPTDQYHLEPGEYLIKTLCGRLSVVTMIEPDAGEWAECLACANSARIIEQRELEAATV